MSWIHGLSGLLAASLAVYLVYALVKAEKF
jgi:K+-transporting ATPase KdpF subunit